MKGDKDVSVIENLMSDRYISLGIDSETPSRSPSILYLGGKDLVVLVRLSAEYSSLDAML